MKYVVIATGAKDNPNDFSLCSRALLNQIKTTRNVRMSDLAELAVSGKYPPLRLKRTWVPVLLFAMLRWVAPMQPFRWMLTAPLSPLLLKLAMVEVLKAKR